MCGFGYFCKKLGENEIVYRERGEQQSTGENLWNINLVVKQKLIKHRQKCKNQGSINKFNAIKFF